VIYLNLPVGSSHGWGIVGRNLTRELALRQSVRFLATAETNNVVDDPLDHFDLSQLIWTGDDSGAHESIDGVRQLDGPLIQQIRDASFVPIAPELRGRPNIGYCFVETNLLQPRFIENGKRNFDRIVTGSTWCTRMLTDYKLPNIATAVQGVDATLFFPHPSASSGRDHFLDRFVVFSGGKFEFRKGHDIVIRAYKVLQDRHRDVMLINAWFNHWFTSVQTMEASRLIRYKAQKGPHVQEMTRLLTEQGIDVSRVITIPRISHLITPRIYRNTDVGIFPNRCEGGTNLVLMEYMACGRPAIATATTGHGDVIQADHAIVMGVKSEVTITTEAGPIARWPEPDLDDAIDKLEWAYQNRDKLRAVGDRAAAAMAPLTWKKTAEVFQNVIGDTL
jgi:glycosyltransferase involved in cell wall biosynthesis